MSNNARQLNAAAARNRAQHAAHCSGHYPLYNPAADLSAPAERLGAEDALALPSRIGNELRYRDGRVERMAA